MDSIESKEINGRYRWDYFSVVLNWNSLTRFMIEWISLVGCTFSKILMAIRDQEAS